MAALCKSVYWQTPQSVCIRNWYLHVCRTSSALRQNVTTIKMYLLKTQQWIAAVVYILQYLQTATEVLVNFMEGRWQLFQHTLTNPDLG